MRRTIQAIARGAVVICFAACGPTRAATWSAAVDEPLEDDDASPVAIVDQAGTPSFTFEEDPTQSFTWTTDATLTPPPYVMSAAEADFVPPIASSTAIPLPPAAWTGLASLGALGAISFLKRLRLYG